MRLSISCLIMLMSTVLFSQTGFKGSAILGFTAAQLGGDSISGFNKLGITAGLKLTYPLSSKFDLNLDLVYVQKGSRESLGFNKSGQNSTALNYLEIPIYVTINDWYIEKDEYFKVGAFAGLSYGYLFSVSTNNTVLNGKEDLFNKSDLSGRIGCYYSFTKSLTLRIFYTDSFLKVLSSEDLFRTNALDSFYWTFRMEYNF